MNTHKLLYAVCALLLLPLSSCDIPLGAGKASKKTLANQIADEGCGDARDFIVEYGGSLIPIVGKTIMDKIIKDKEGKGAFCDCMKDPVSDALSKRFSVEGLQEILENDAKRQAQMAEVILEHRKEIMDCYKASGAGKGIKLLDKVLDKVSKDLDKFKDKIEAELEEQLEE